jgi:PPOX class probable F420-dependent enzyme
MIEEDDHMAIKLPESARKLLQDKAYGHVVTVGPNGRPQVTMVWMDAEGDEVLFNTAEGRKKPQNLRRDPRVVISVHDQNNPQAYLLVHGTATLTEAGADAHIDKLAKRFLGVDKYPYRQPGEKRLQVRVKVDRLGGFAPGMKPWQ